MCAAGLAALVTLVIAAPAQASFERTLGKDVDQTGGTGFEACTVAASCKTGLTGGLGGELAGPHAAAADGVGNVYVADTSNNRIQKFDASGSFLRAWGNDVASAGPGNTGPGFEICVAANGDTCQTGVSGELGGELNVPAGVAAAGAGNVYIADHANQRMQNFDSSGAFLRAWGRDVVNGNVGTGFEACTVAASCQTGTWGGLGGELVDPGGVAANAAGNVYVADTDNRRIQKFLARRASPERRRGRHHDAAQQRVHDREAEGQEARADRPGAR